MKKVQEWLDRWFKETKKEIERAVKKISKDKHFSKLKSKYYGYLERGYDKFIGEKVHSERSIGCVVKNPMQGVLYQARMIREEAKDMDKWEIADIESSNKYSIPVLIETSGFLKDSTARKSPAHQYHIFILLHGLDASHLNMIKLMKHISIACENVEFILPQAMDKKNSRQSIQKSAEEITAEITEHLDNNFEIEDVSGISFI